MKLFYLFLLDILRAILGMMMQIPSSSKEAREKVELTYYGWQTGVSFFRHTFLLHLLLIIYDFKKIFILYKYRNDCKFNEFSKRYRFSLLLTVHFLVVYAYLGMFYSPEVYTYNLDTLIHILIPLIWSTYIH